MVAVLPPLLSDQPPEVPQRVGLGDRFHYFRGLSGRRYLFSAIEREDVGDFRSAVALIAHRAPGGRLAASWIGLTDPFGRVEGANRRLPTASSDSVVLVHLLSATDGERRALLADLAAPASAAAIAA